VEAKVGMIERIRKALGGSPSDHAHGHSAQSAAPSQYQPHLELLRDTARDLCSDTWLANQIVVDVKMENGKPTLSSMPAGSMPYVRAAYAIRKNEMPADIKGMFDGMAS
jgi:hypothetical protein